MTGTARPSGVALAAGHYHLATSDATRVVEHQMEAQAQLMAAQRILSGARFVPGWDGHTERRRETKHRNGAYSKRSEARA